MIRKALKFVWRWTWKLSLLFIVLSNLWVLLYKWIDPPITFVMIGKYLKSDVADKSIDYKWVDLDEIAGHLQLAAICSEDQTFTSHSGFEIAAIKKAMQENKKGKKIRGASTISQQVAKNAFLWTGRSWLRKGLETYFTFLIETYWSKARILEVYLNIVELGPNVYGAEASSKKYFKRPAIKLSKEQAALIVVALPNPIKFSIGRPGPYMLKRQVWVLRQMANFGGTGYLKNLYED